MNEQVWQQASECVSTQVEDDLILLSLDLGRYFSLNATAAAVWEALVSPISERALVDVLTARFDIDADQCLLAVRRVLDDLAAKGLVKASS